MTTNELLTKMEEAAFAPFYQEEIKAIFDHDVSSGKFDAETRDYTNAMKYLSKKLDPEKLTLLSEYESICQQIREFSARYGFIAGIFCGFKQLFTPDRAIDGGFNKYVVEDIAWKPRMERHTANYANINKRNDLYSRIVDGADKRTHNGMVSVDCYWSQVAHSASLNGFYCGYRAAGSITDQVALMEHHYMDRISKQITMEHTLGYIESYSDIERRIEREKVPA